MKRILSLIFVLTLMLSFSGCSLFAKEEEEEEFDVEACLEEVEALVEDGELEEAERLLKKGIRRAEDTEELEAYLEIVQAMMEGDELPNAETAYDTRAPENTTESTQTPVTEAPANIDLLDSFSDDEIYQINIFLSNFSEQRFKAYPCSDYDLLFFGYMYAKVNNREVLGNTSTDYYVNKANMDSILKRFFGTTVEVADGTVLDEHNYPVTYRDGTYYYPAADGASVSYCSIATSMVDNGNGTYTVTFDNYQGVEPHMSMSPYYGMTDAQASARSDIEKYGSGTAVVRDYTRSNGVESYQLISYSTN